MNLAVVAVRNIARNKARASLTILGVAFAILTFVLLRTVIGSWSAGLDQSTADHVWIRNKITFILPLPKKFLDEVRQTPGVKAATYANFFGGKDPAHEREMFTSVAVDAPSMMEVFDEYDIDPAELAAWKSNRQGALVGDVLLRRMGWKVGDRVTLRGTAYPGDWPFEIVASYRAKRASVDRATFYFHWKYLNDSLPPARQDQIGWMTVSVAGPSQSASVCRAVDAKFADRDVQTLCMSERAMRASALGTMSAALSAIDVVSVATLAIVLLILGNTIAMGVRERTREYGTLRAIGFAPWQLAFFIMGESMVTGALGGVVGLILSYPIVERGVGRFLQDYMGSMFPVFRIQAPMAIAAIALAVALSALAAAAPAYRLFRLKTVDALRQID